MVEKKKKKPGRTLSQAERRANGAKQLITLCLTPEGLEALDMLRGTESRGEYVEGLLEIVMVQHG